MAKPRVWRQVLELLSGLKIPSNAGVGKVLSSDEEGNATWALPGEKSVAMAYRSAAQKLPNGAETQIKLDTIIKDPGGNISTAKGVYVVPSDGYYSVLGEILFIPGTVTTSIKAAAFVKVNKEKKLDGNWIISTVTSNVFGLTVSGIVFCKKGEEIELVAFQEDPALGAEKDLATGPQANFLHVTRVGEGPPGVDGKVGEFLSLEEISAKLENGKAAGFGAPSARTENSGATARMLGRFAVKAANTLSGAVEVFTLPPACRPTQVRQVNVFCSNEASEYTQISLSIAISGKVTISSKALTGVNKMKAADEFSIEATFPL